MSSRWIPTKDSKRQKELKWLNGITHLHDIYCNCYNPLTHTATFILEKERKHNFSAPEKQILQQCLTGEDHTVATADTEDNLEEGDLDTLFQEPFTEEDTEG